MRIQVPPPIVRAEFSDDVGSYIRDSGLEGFGYHVVAVFGSQSTGKSTLLNRLFGTEFAVMDETQRKQTTKGMYPPHGPRAVLRFGVWAGVDAV